MNAQPEERTAHSASPAPTSSASPAPASSASPAPTSSASPSAPPPAPPPAHYRAPKSQSRLLGYIALTKPRIIELLLVTTIPPMIVANANLVDSAGGVTPAGASQSLPSFWLMLATVVGGTLAAAGANTFNMYIDQDIDRVMKRTSNRPLVTGVVSRKGALVFAIVLEVLAFALLWGTVNLLSACLALAACLFYVFVYSIWLKRKSSQNIVIGGAAGAVPVLVGWAAVTGSLGIAPWLGFALVFFWTPPHFWALAIRYADEYAAAKVPMLPVVATMRKTAQQITLYAVVVVALSLGFGIAAELGALYWIVAVATGALFTAQTLRLWREQTTACAMKVFHYSNGYLGLLFCAMAADVIVRNGW